MVLGYRDFDGIHRENGFIEKNVKGEMLLQFCDEKIMRSKYLVKNEVRKKINKSGGNRTEIDFVLIFKRC